LLTADPAEHLTRAERLLAKDNAHLLYAALEIRFALERIANNEVVFAERASERMVDSPDPVKKLRRLRELDPRTGLAHTVFQVAPVGEFHEIARDVPIYLEWAQKTTGRLGDYLHPTNGLNLGLASDPWYSDLRSFLTKAIRYLKGRVGSTESCLFENMENILRPIIAR
jgi:hypothetical protein